MSDGAVYLSCGCRHTPDMGEIGSLLRVWTEEVYTRDFDNPFVMAEVSGVYCDECWKRMQEPTDE